MKPPSLRLAVLTCMEVDFALYQLLTRRREDADIVTNSGGVATPDVLHDLSLSQKENSTSQVVVLHHTSCSLLPYTECFQKVQLARNADGLPDFPLPDAIPYTLRATIEAIVACTSIPYRNRVVGYMFNDSSRALRRTN